MTIICLKQPEKLTQTLASNRIPYSQNLPVTQPVHQSFPYSSTKRIQLFRKETNIGPEHYGHLNYGYRHKALK